MDDALKTGPSHPPAPEENHAQQRRERLSGASRAFDVFNPLYTRHIRRLRLILPLLAVAIIAAVLGSSIFLDSGLKPLQTTAERIVGKNELLNPRFESRDDKNQPYTITASRALQGENGDDDLVVLENPMADLLLQSGHWLAARAAQGAFRQKTRLLLLKGEVQLFHDTGYLMEMTQLHIDMKKNLAWSTDPVRGQGPAGTLAAQGLQADNAREILIFHGPAKLVLYQTSAQAGLGDLP